jgi:hypothetical protein
MHHAKGLVRIIYNKLFRRHYELYVYKLNRYNVGMPRTNQRFIAVVVVIVLAAIGVGVSLLFRPGNGGQSTAVSDTSQGTNIIRVTPQYSIDISEDLSSMTIYGWITNTSSKTVSVVLRLEVSDRQTGQPLGTFTTVAKHAEPQQETPFVATHKPFTDSRRVAVKIIPVGSFSE